MPMDSDLKVLMVNWWLPASCRGIFWWIIILVTLATFLLVYTLIFLVVLIIPLLREEVASVLLGRQSR